MGWIVHVGGVMAAAAAMGGPALASRPVGEGRVDVRLIAEKAALVPGETNWLGVAFDIEKDWHLYWKGQNDSGMPIAVTPELPAGYEAGELLWPAPVRHELEGDILDHIYEKRVVLLLPVKVPAGAKPGQVTLKVKAEWMVCKTMCLLGDGSATLSTKVADAGEEPGPGRDAKLFAEARERLPRPLPADGSMLATEWKGSTLLVTSKKGRKLAFYPYEDSARMESIIKDAVSDKGRLELKLKEPGAVKGVVEISEPGSNVRPLLYVLDVPAPGATHESTPASPGPRREP